MDNKVRLKLLDLFLAVPGINDFTTRTTLSDGIPNSPRRRISWLVIFLSLLLSINLISLNTKQAHFYLPSLTVISAHL